MVEVKLKIVEIDSEKKIIGFDSSYMRVPLLNSNCVFIALVMNGN